MGEARENTIKEDGKNRTSEERVSRPNSQVGLSEVSRSVGKETETAAGDDGSLHLNWRVTTFQTKDPDESTTEQQVQQPNPDNANVGLQVNEKTKYTVRYSAFGTQETKTVQSRDIHGNLNVVSVEAEKSNRVPPPQGR